MFTVLVIVSGPSITSHYVKHFSSLAAAQAFQPVGVGCSSQVVAIFKGRLSASSALARWW